MRDLGTYLLQCGVMAAEWLIAGQIARWLWDTIGGK